MFEFIENLRQKPNSTKKKIAFLTSFSVSAIIFVVWISVIYPDMKNENRVISTTSSSTPIETFTGFMSDGFSQMKEKLSEVANVFSSLSSTTSMYYATSTTQETTSARVESTTTEPNIAPENQ